MRNEDMTRAVQTFCMTETNVQLCTMKALEAVRETCERSKACIRCPLCRYTHRAIMEQKKYKAQDLCAVYDVFGQIPMKMDLSKITRLFEEGRIGNEILHQENSGEPGERGCSDSQTSASADRSNGNTEDTRTDN